MPRMKFDWDWEKAAANEQNHDVSFDEAQDVFYDAHAVVERDIEHSQDEDRFRIIGLSSHKLLVVIYTERGGIIHLISAREAEKHHRRIYEDQP